MGKNYFNIWKCAWDFHKSHVNAPTEKLMKDAREVTSKAGNDAFLNDIIVAVINEIERERSNIRKE